MHKKWISQTNWMCNVIASIANQRSFVLGVLLVSICAPSLADETSRPAALESVYDYAGVHAHLSWVHSTVNDEIKMALEKCEAVQDRTELDALLIESLSIDVLRQGFIDELDQRINDEQLSLIIDWTQSAAGKNIHKAELDSLHIDESTFQSLLAAYKQSDVDSDERTARMRHMLADTGAVYFLSALNTELSALVSIASVCSNSDDDLAAAQKQIREDRGSEALYRSFMRQELITPSAVIYRNVSDAELDALNDFAKSDAGDAYFTALIKGTRSLLAKRVDRLSEMLETMPKSDN